MGIIRRIRKVIIGRHTNSHRVDNLGGTEEIHSMSERDDALESVYCEEKVNHHCGCFGREGGRCSECGMISCVRCHQHCGGSDNPSPLGCGSPLCREHACYTLIDNSMTLPLCRQCKDRYTRKQRLNKATRCLLDPFVEFDNVE